MQNQRQLRNELTALLQTYGHQLNLIEGIVSGSFSLNQVKAIGTALYAEARSALQVKLPERIRICPLTAVDARHLWWKLLEEESGDFKAGHDHASLLSHTLRYLGVTDREMEAEYERLLSSVQPLREQPTSMDATLRELSGVYVEEHLLATHANRVGDALRDHYGVPEEHVYYFRLHSVMDIEHSDAILTEILRHARTESETHLVLAAAEATLKNFPAWLPGTHRSALQSE